MGIFLILFVHINNHNIIHVKAKEKKKSSHNIFAHKYTCKINYCIMYIIYTLIQLKLRMYVYVGKENNNENININV